MSFESSSLADSLKLDGTYGGGGANGTTGSNSDLVIKQEPSVPVTDAEMHALAKDRQKKDNHNMSTLFFHRNLISGTHTHKKQAFNFPSASSSIALGMSGYDDAKHRLINRIPFHTIFS